MKLTPCYKCGGKTESVLGIEIPVGPWRVKTHAYSEKCTECGTEVFQQRELARAEVEAMTTVLRDLTLQLPGSVLQHARKIAGLRVQELAEKLDCDADWLAEIERSKEPVPRLVRLSMVWVVEEFGADEPLRLAV
jgi:Helix-turn-helix domain